MGTDTVRGRHRRRPADGREQRLAVALVEWYWVRRRIMDDTAAAVAAAHS